MSAPAEARLAALHHQPLAGLTAVVDGPACQQMLAVAGRESRVLSAVSSLLASAPPPDSAPPAELSALGLRRDGVRRRPQRVRRVRPEIGR